MAEVIWAASALQDLDAIADYVALDKPEAANALVLEVFDRVEQLSLYPESGSVPKDLRGTRYRHLVIPPLRVIYRIEAARVYLVSVLRGERTVSIDLLE